MITAAVFRSDRTVRYVVQTLTEESVAERLEEGETYRIVPEACIRGAPVPPYDELPEPESV